jgi:glycosyltransferase involved in cell wall biosynthesis
MRLHGGPSVTTLSDLQSYKKIITISNFCQFWIHKYWNLDSEILYPPVNTKAFKPDSKKKNWITHIGRFFVTGHSKKQLELIRVFKDLVDHKQIDETWELHFIGSIHEGRAHQDYFEACVAEAAQYPIHFHIGIPFGDLRKILGQSKIYWHATGLDQDPSRQPILMEHFGITTVEAMAAGCVPIVINRGGQPEIITPDSGFVWNTREELKSYTVKIAHDDTLRKQLMHGAIRRSEYFGIEAFKKRFKEIIAED